MKNNLLLTFVLICFAISSCKKGSDKEEGVNYGTVENTWTFTEGSNTFQGTILFDAASLNTLLQSNNSYEFAMTGFEKNSGYMFSIFLSLVDLNFNTRIYQSGIAGDDYRNAFHYNVSPASVDDIYKSSNLDPGPAMTFTVDSFDPAKDIVTISFSGKAQTDENGNTVDITNGKVTTKISRL